MTTPQAPESHPPPNDTNDTFLGITRADRLVVTVLVVTSLVLMAAHWAQLSGWGTQPIEIDRIPRTPVGFRLDLNTTNWVELSQLEGIGPKLAQRIITDREQNGPFAEVEDLGRVRGIGQRTIARLRPWLRVGDQP
jgi:competence protein ComEA|tara:strand:- start:636 stop:1043 length:408 start_codon:yes stop_codon:yes gene_type:complete